MMKPNKKLTLAKETVRNLSAASLAQANGGGYVIIAIAGISGKLTCADSCKCQISNGGASYVAGDCNTLSLIGFC